MQIEQFKHNIKAVEENCELIQTPCADGTMPFRIWHPDDASLSGEVVVLLHGGSGSWTHWIRNIDCLSTYYQVLVPDLPGLGDAASLFDGYQPRDSVDAVARGIKKIIGDRGYHLVAFSWGCVVASLLAAQHGRQVKSLMLIGPASMGKMPRLQMKPLIPRTPGMSETEVFAANRENLARLMICNRKKIDDFAVYLQTENTRRARFRSPQFAIGSYVLDGVKASSAPLFVLYGEFDAAAYPNIDARHEKLRRLRPDVRFEVLPENGHWLQYESADSFNTRCIQWIEANVFS